MEHVNRDPKETRPAVLTMALVLVLGLAGLFGPTVSEAAVVGVTATPGVRSVPLGRAGNVAMVWNVTRDVSTGGGATVSSASGSFRAGSPTGTLLATVARPLSQTRPPVGVTIFAFRESVLVPSRVIYRAHKLGVDRIYFVRSFDDGVAASTGAVALSITGSGAGSFGVTRLALSFGDGSVIAVAQPDAPLQAVAQITVSGSGLLQAVWEVADAAGTAGTPAFRPLQTVRRYVNGREPLRLESPPLPTRLLGLHLVRLRITQPAADFELPQLRYFVRAESAQAPVAALSLEAPAPDAVLQAETEFAWRAVPETRAYRLEIRALDDDGGRATTGLVVDGRRSAASLSAVTRDHLRAGGRYRWRVLAIDDQGRVVARSDWREIRTP